MEILSIYQTLNNEHAAMHSLQQKGSFSTVTVQPKTSVKM